MAAVTAAHDGGRLQRVPERVGQASPPNVRNRWDPPVAPNATVTEHNLTLTYLEDVKSQCNDLKANGRLGRHGRAA